MMETIHTALASWADFYLITGTAAAALTGLQFVVQTLLASETLRPVTSGDPEGGVDAFGTPTVVHFTLALLISALMCVPWTGPDELRGTLGAMGLAALVYSVIVLRRARRQKSYTPVMEDWIWHAVLPGVAYTAVVACAVLLDSERTAALFAVAGATLVLLCIGIHNAWDTVTYLTLNAMRADSSATQPASPRKESGKQRRRHR